MQNHITRTLSLVAIVILTTAGLVQASDFLEPREPWGSSSCQHHRHHAKATTATAHSASPVAHRRHAHELIQERIKVREAQGAGHRGWRYVAPGEFTAKELDGPVQYVDFNRDAKDAKRIRAIGDRLEKMANSLEAPNKVTPPEVKRQINAVVNP